MRPGRLDSTEGSRRQAGRVFCEIVHSNIGRVLDVSRGGMRIEIDHKLPLEPGMKMDIQIAFKDESIQAPVVVSWVKRKGLFKRELGVEFRDLTPDLQEVLNHVARDAASNAGPGFRKSKRLAS